MRTLFSSVLLIACLATSVEAQLCTRELDQEQTDATGSWVRVRHFQEAAQTFRAGLTGTVDSVRTWIASWKAATGGPGDSVTMTLQEADASGPYTGPGDKTVMRQIDGLDSASVNTFSFSTQSYQLTAGQDYAIVLQVFSVDSLVGTEVRWSGSGTEGVDSYPNGQAFSRQENAGIDWDDHEPELASIDRYFEVWVCAE